ncbi:RluA family pseudouridine synthase [Xanthomonas sp. XNM01]|uniref:RluA family pseudouridine synthase n=1 Tax=Xanthomonas sp. XNM01 TaxID=2769289 RepID=UPI00177DF934|nr:RluA family pseudouridine synthase [Xanthomonas sp. XNM01]MBD9370383.1 RluA family pseudouridine synthase [Xanthomonas sp. XNM01]
MTVERAIRDGIVASRLQLPPGPWKTVFDALRARFPEVDAATWQNRFARGCVLDADGQPLDASAPYRIGAEIQYFREVPDEPVIPFTETVVHADAHLVVACKPHFLPVAPTGAYVRETLLTRLVRRFGNPDLVPLHRIDRDTAGLVLFSACRETRGIYQALFRERRIRKHYLAVAAPLPGLRFPYVHRSRLEPGEPFFRMREGAGAPNSETVIDVVARGAEMWTYRLEPVTGRKHQLRVHMAALGAPILHDRFYPDLEDERPDDPERPLQLLAETLAFDDPRDGEPRCFTARSRLSAAWSPPGSAQMQQGAEHGPHDP